ncbi:alpha/beta fold hydrolase [Sphingoaurantiacus capsulatus]|uniref:Alpha/beta fold hydrolase n=1 Tax=Sphingoaurantiacus capsulatus TaxID=1771310 RepID=A0ABV7XCB7_9SPHN
MAARRRRWPWVVGAIVALLAVALLWLRTPDLPVDELRAKYANAESEFVEVMPGLTVHVRDEGPVLGSVVMLLHGSNASLHTWEPWVQQLKATHRVISFDHPGHGLTGPHPRDCYTAACFTEVVEAVAKNRKLDRFVIAGNSMGGWIAWNYALKHPERVAGLVLVDASGAPLPPEAEPSQPIGFRLARTPGVNQLMRQITPRSMVEKSLRQSVSVQDSVTPTVVDRYWELLRYPGNRRATGIRFGTPRETATPDVLGKIGAPTLVMWGREDRLVPAQAATVFDEYIPNSRAVIYEDIGHIPMEEAPFRSVGDLQAFLGELGPFY